MPDRPVTEQVRRPFAGPGQAAGPADPVRELIETHRELCEQAVHPLEIAAALEEAGIGSDAAGYYRHADVFGLAEELFARVARRPPLDPSPVPREPAARRLGAALRRGGLHALAIAGLAGVHAVVPLADLPSAAAAVLLLALVAAPGGSGPVRAGYGLGVVLLLAPAVHAGGGPAALAVATAAGAGSAEWLARWLRRTGRVQVACTTTFADFRLRMRPVLPVAAVLQLAAVAGAGFAAVAVASVLAPRPGPAGLVAATVHRVSGAGWADHTAVGLLLFLAVVLSYAGRAAVAVAGLLAAGILGWPTVPGAVRTAVAALGGPGAVDRLLPADGWGRPVPAVFAGVLFLLAWSVLGRATTHRLPEDGPVDRPVDGR